MTILLTLLLGHSPSFADAYDDFRRVSAFRDGYYEAAPNSDAGCPSGCFHARREDEGTIAVYVDERRLISGVGGGDINRECLHEASAFDRDTITIMRSISCPYRTTLLRLIRLEEGGFYFGTSDGSGTGRRARGCHLRPVAPAPRNCAVD